MIDVRFNIALNGKHYLGVSLREDTTTIETAEEFEAKLKQIYPEEDGYKITANVRPCGVSYSPYEGQTLGELIKEVGGIRLSNAHYNSKG